MKRKVLISLIFVLLSAVSVFSMGRNSGGNGNHPGGGGIPEPATILLILGGAGAALVTKKFLGKK